MAADERLEGKSGGVLKLPDASYTILVKLHISKLAVAH